jgi:hypothetical protein
MDALQNFTFRFFVWESNPAVAYQVLTNQVNLLLRVVADAHYGESDCPLYAVRVSQAN